MRLSDEYIIKHGTIVDLLENGEFEIEDVVLNEEDDIVYLRGTYSYKGWTFLNSEIAIKWVKYEGNLYSPVGLLEATKDIYGDYADAILYSYWEDWIVYPTDETEVIERGNPEDIKGTSFEECIN